jgi:uncharacterized protein (UPF0332 family)
MNYSNLLKNNRIKPGNFSKKQVQDRINLAKRDINTAMKIVNEDPDWGYNIAYNAALQAARSLMLSKGYRSVGEGQHATTIEFAKLTLDVQFQPTIDLIDRMRRKRNRAVYDVAGVISKKEAKHAIRTAVSFVNDISTMLGLK